MKKDGRTEWEERQLDGENLSTQQEQVTSIVNLNININVMF